MRFPSEEQQQDSAAVIEVQGVRVDSNNQIAYQDGEAIRLTRMEFKLLHALISRAGSVVTREELMQGVWEVSFWTSTKTIDVHLGWLRRKLGDNPRDPRLITTLRGQGLRFEVTGPSGGDAL